MEFKDAYYLMLAGEHIRLPNWGGYWYWDADKSTIMMHLRHPDPAGRTELDIRETQHVAYTISNMLRDEWAVLDMCDPPVVRFGFDDAIKAVKRGLRVQRAGWNGKSQYIQLAKDITYTMPDGAESACTHKDIGSQAIAFVGTSGVQMGWLASQADMLADDWRYVDE